MKTKYDTGDHVLIEAVVTEILISKNNIQYWVRTTDAINNYGTAVLKIYEADIKTVPDEFNGCDNCKHDRVPMTAYPCSDCEHNHISHYEPKEDEDVIDE